MERLKQPKRSPASESAPHWSTMAPGRYVSTTFEIIYKIEFASKRFTIDTINWHKDINQTELTVLKSRVKLVSSIPSLSGTLMA